MPQTTLEMEEQQLPRELWNWESNDVATSRAWREAGSRLSTNTDYTVTGVSALCAESERLTAVDTLAPIVETTTTIDYAQADWKRAMGHRTAWKRMVATVDYWAGRATEFRNIRPWRNGMATYEYNVVLSLCDDGRHRANLDWDTGAAISRRGIVIPSRHHSHVYYVAGQRYLRYRVFLDAHVAAGNIQQGWRNSICQNGFTVTRTPWNPNPEDEDQTVDYN